MAGAYTIVPPGRNDPLSQRQGSAIIPAMPAVPEPLRPAFEAFSRGPAMLRQAVTGLTPPQLGRRPASEDWSIRDTIFHLTDAELVTAVRLRFVIAEDDPPLQGFDQDIWKRRLHYLFRDLDAAIAQFELVRHGNAELLAQCARDTWERRGIHSSGGPRTLADLLEGAVEHLAEHLAYIDSARAGKP